MEQRVRCVLPVLALGLTLFVTKIDGGQAAAQGHNGRYHACIFDHSSLRTAAGTCRPRALAYPGTVKGKVERAIYDSSLTFGIPYTVLLQIAECESALDPHARSGTHYGLFQFLPQTFHTGARELGVETGIQARTPWSARDASYVAGYLFAVGRAKNWSCEPFSS